MSEPEPEEPTPEEGMPAEGVPAESIEEKRARVMRRLAEMIRADPPDLGGSGPVSAGEFPSLPDSAEEFDQEKADELFAALGQFFEQHRKRAGGPGDKGLQEE